MRATTTRSTPRASTASICRACPSSATVANLLLRDLAQVVSPAGSGTPLRGRALGEVDVLEDAYVLCDGDRVSEVGRMRDLRLPGGDVDQHRRWMLRSGTTAWEGKSGYGLDRDTELTSLRAVRDAGGVPTWLGAHAIPPEFDDADRYLDFALAEVLPEAARIAEAADVFLERGAFDAAQARRYLTACRD